MGAGSESQAAVAIIFLVIIGLVLLIDAVLFIAWAIRKDAVDAGMAPPLFAPRWSLMDVWVSAHVVIGGVIAGSILAGVILAAALAPDLLNPRSSSLMLERIQFPLIAVGLVIQAVLMTGAPIVYITQKYRTSLREIGLPGMPRRPDIGRGLFWGAGLLLAGVTLEWLLVFAVRAAMGAEGARALEQVTKDLTVTGLMKGGISPGMLVALLIGAGILAPVSEEVFFRGFLYNCARRRFGVPIGMILSGFIFALVHIGPLAVIVIFFIGVLLAAAYERSGSLWVPIIMHAVNNSVQIVAAFFIPDLVK